MRIVKSLSELHYCPNCGSPDHLRETENEFGRPHLTCINCHEEIFTDEDTQYEPINVGKAPDDIDDTLMEIEYELYTYEMLASTQHELLMANCMRGILEKFISVIRRMK